MRPVALTLVAIAVLIVPAARAGDVDDLKAASEAYTEALNKQDVSTVLASYHDDAVTYGPNAVFPQRPERTVRSRPTAGLGKFLRQS